MLNDFYHMLDPVAISAGPITIYWYGLAYVVGALLAEESRYADPDTERYVRIFSALQNALAARAEAVYLAELGTLRCIKRKEDV